MSPKFGLRSPEYDHRMPVDPPVITAFILAGGKSTRMGTDKAFISLDGHTLLARALDRIRLPVSTDPGIFKRRSAEIRIRDSRTPSRKVSRIAIRLSGLMYA